MSSLNFSELNLHPALQQALGEEGYSTPTPIQLQTIPHLLQGRDVLGCAQTGTGKTAAFALPILNQLGSSQRKSIPKTPRALILAPTRELAAQIGESLTTYGRHLKLRVAVIFGGVSQFHQIRVLARGVHIVVATPGRLLDLMNQEQIQLNALETFVLDEADRMLDMGFFPDIKRIMKALPERRQSMFFSATLDARVLELAQQLLSNPVEVTVSPPASTVELIEQRVIHTERSHKKSLLVQVLQRPGVDRAVVFTRTKRGADVICQHLSRSGLSAEAIHGNKSQNARQRILEQFKRNRIQVLVATDLAARGLDIDGISHVVNFDMPMEPDAYVHRIGRTGRAGATGVAISLCDAGERSDLRAIERLIGLKIPVDQELSLPLNETAREAQPAEQRTRSNGSRRPERRRNSNRRFQESPRESSRTPHADQRRPAEDSRRSNHSVHSPRGDRSERKRRPVEHRQHREQERPLEHERSSAPHRPDRPHRSQSASAAPAERHDRQRGPFGPSERRQAAERRQGNANPSGRPPRRRFRTASTGK